MVWSKHPHYPLTHYAEYALLWGHSRLRDEASPVSIMATSLTMAKATFERFRDQAEGQANQAYTHLVPTFLCRLRIAVTDIVVTCHPLIHRTISDPKIAEMHTYLF